MSEIVEQYNQRIKELEKSISELKVKQAYLNELQSKVREHKHNYSEDFGLVVSVPLQALLKELIQNPNVFTVDEREQIISLYTTSIEMRGTYECLGWPIDIQLKRVREHVVPQIKKNADFFSAILCSERIFSDKRIVSKLDMACKETDSLCNRLNNIEHFDYGTSKVFNIRDTIREVFNKDNDAACNRGCSPIQLETCFGEYSDVMVEMNQEGFEKYFLGNIIKNLHDHAFKEFDDFQFSNIGIPEKKVRISFEQDPCDSHRLNLIIENNGKAFGGDVNSIFDNGIGDGSGIGLFSAKQFLKAFGASIKMFIRQSDEYKVGFTINLPIKI